MYLLRVGIVSLSATLLLAACSQQAMIYGAKGAATGGGGAAFVSAMTDLIIDGKVDSDRLTRAAVGGAVAGATAGAIYGQQQSNLSARSAGNQVPSTPAVNQLRAQFGEQNTQSAVALVNCDHQQAFRYALDAEKSSDQQQRNAAIALQALIDADRGNSSASRATMQRYQQATGHSAANVSSGLSQLQQQLYNERRVAGQPTNCR